MNDSGRILTTALWSLCALSAASGCHSARPKTAADPAQVSRRLESLPATATFAWVNPSMLIADATSEDDQSATLGSVRQMHLDVEAVLKGEHWEVAASDTAQFLATIALVKRTTYQPEQRALPATELPQRRCDATTGGCRGGTPTAQPRYQTVSVPVTTERVVFVIARRSDGARHVHAGGFLNAQSSGGLFAQQVITLLRAW